jgi:hypothetical protein
MGKHKTLNHKNRSKNASLFKLFYGVLHSHTSFSTGKGTPRDAYTHAKKQKLNFLAVTDHLAYLHQIFKENNKNNTLWIKTLSTAKFLNKKHKSFASLVGFECKVKSVGHLNIYNSNELPPKNFSSITDLISWLKHNDKSVVCINHPHNQVKKLLKYPDLKQYISLMEVGNGSWPNKYERYYPIYFSFLDNGWQLGAVIGQDNHKDNWGEDEKLSVVISENLSTRAIMDALYHRRTFASESRSLKLDFKINDTIMGEILNCVPNETLYINIEAEDPKIPIKQISLITNKGLCLKKLQLSDQYKADVNFSYESNIEESWYAVMIEQQGNRLSLSSPIFIKNSL